MENYLTGSLRVELSNALSGFVHGWCTVEKAIDLAEIIVSSKSKTCVELGVYSGKSLIPQAMALRSVGAGIVYGIDPWKKDNAAEGNCSDADKAWWNSVDLDAIHNYCMSKIWEHGLDKWCCIIRSQSYHCHQIIDAIDLLHIDGCHSEEASTMDVALWLPKVRIGGNVCFDDIDWPTTKKAQGMILETCDKVKDCGSYAIYKKVM